MPGIDESARDAGVIEHMLLYCEQLQETLREIDGDESRFLASATYRNAVAMCILQLGELTKHLSPGFVTAHPQIPWRVMARTRDHYAHHYGEMDFGLVWKTATDDIPAVQRFCAAYLNAPE